MCAMLSIVGTVSPKSHRSCVSDAWLSRRKAHLCHCPRSGDVLYQLSRSILALQEEVEILDFFDG